MFCVNCGSKNSDEAIYCQKCGRLLEAEEQTRVARKTPNENVIKEFDEERRIFTVSPTLMFIKIGYAAAIFGAILLVAVLSVLYEYLKIPA
ncbi:MAG TPA: zinc-ribbon domain-containing protein, partial [Pyrinomonadaceae bacterium]